MVSANSTALLILISAPSGGGKTTLCERLLAVRSNMTRAVTCTTRQPRPGEKEGSDYYFMDPDTFLKGVQAGNFLEHATVHGSSYGVLKAELESKLRQGRDVLLSVDVQGAATFKKQAEQDPLLRQALVTVFLAPLTIAVLEERLRKRGTDAPDVIQKRLSVARQEIAQWRHFDYLIISSTVAEDLRRMLVILEAEHLRYPRVHPPGFD